MRDYDGEKIYPTGKPPTIKGPDVAARAAFPKKWYGFLSQSWYNNVYASLRPVSGRRSAAKWLQV